MTDLNTQIKTALSDLGADITGFGSLAELPEHVREGMPVGISVAVAYPKAVIRGIAELPTLEYREWYDKLNEQLDAVVTKGAEQLRGMGYAAIAQTRARVRIGNEDARLLPHKTAATRAGIGWIGKCALLVTEKYGSAVRLSAILTDAPLETSPPVNISRCGDCAICADTCPAGAVSGISWDVSMKREDFYDAAACRDTARRRAKQGFGGDLTICGKCIYVCPYTQRYINAP